jgi:hypothetical protein
MPPADEPLKDVLPALLQGVIPAQAGIQRAKRK